jgi:hypothetical protein
MASRVRFSISSKTAYDLVSQLESGELQIPAHQRGEVWPLKRQIAFIRSVIEGIPTQAIIVRKIDRNGDTTSLEDGQQRLSTLKKFMTDEIEGPTGKFSELTGIMQNNIRMYAFAVTIYNNATLSQTITIFDHFQNGVALTTGERIHSMSAISPLVRFVKTQLMTSGVGLHDRAALVWGIRSGEDKRRKDLLMASALCAGLAFGVDAITKKWTDWQSNSWLSDEIDEDAVINLLETIITIYERVEQRKPLRGKKILNMQWQVGKFSGYIAYSLITFPDSTAVLIRGWVNFLANARDHPENIKNILHKDVKKTRSWNSERWELGYLRVFNPDEAERREAADAARRAADTDESDEDDESDV